MSDAAPRGHESSRNIVICSDGTGNSANKDRGTNVFKLYEAVDIHGFRTGTVPRQFAFYDDGVGTDPLLPVKLLGTMFGYGLSRNVRRLYTNLARVYEPGDKLFLFGFSRGAFTARTLAGLIECCGIPDRNACPTSAELRRAVKESYNEYRRRYRTFWGRMFRADYKEEAPAQRTQLKALVHPVHAPEGKIKIEFIGVWDTVDAVGTPFDGLADFWDKYVYPFRFHDRGLTPQVVRACHAISIDDERQTFRPVLWNEETATAGQIEQVWFAGVHSNVGGGYPKQGMSLVALDWMMAQAEARGLKFIGSDLASIREHRDVHDTLYDSRGGLGVYYRWLPRDIAKICAGNRVTPKIHVSVLERIAQGTGGYAPGNIPANLEVVGTPGTPGPAQLDRMRNLLQSELNSLGVSSLLGRSDMQRQVRVGRFSYYSFLALSIAALCLGLLQSLPDWRNLGRLELAVELGDLLIQLWNEFPFSIKLWDVVKNVAWWLVPGIIICYVLASKVDGGMDRCFSAFWHGLRARLRKLS